MWYSARRTLVRVLGYGGCLLAIYLGGCSSSPSRVYTVGVDPYWFPLELVNREAYLFAFTAELLELVAQEKHLHIQRAAANWDDLLYGLTAHKYDAVCSSLEPYNFNLEKYSFSKNFFDTGLVLVATVEASDMGSFIEKTIAVMTSEDEQLLMQKYPEAFFHRYDSLPKAFEALREGSVQALATDYLQACNYISDLYSEKCKIISPPLSPEGIKLVTLAKEEPYFLKLFNEGLQQLKKNGVYDKLLKKWKLTP